jgi:Zn-dependent M16 (insulinase) family peptidase
MAPRIIYIRLLIIILLFSQLAIAQENQVSLSSLTQDEIIQGFKVTAVYLNDADKPMGARFLHESTGFILDLLQIESVPQTFIYVNSFPVSDKGEPHTQEHLLITKGNKGHELNTREGMSLAESNAFTSQIHTVYNFNTGAGPDVFYTLFEGYMDALLYPDYTDEEVRREVRNWGVAQLPDKSLKIEEKGSVYNEMSTTMNNPWAILFDSAGRLLYGNTHPLALNSGGLPAGIRVLTEKDINKFHADNYWLGNMGAIVSLPSSMTLGSVLGRMNNILVRLNKGVTTSEHRMSQMPPPAPAKTGTISVLDFPAENANQPGSMVFAWQPDLNINMKEFLELNVFMSVFAGDATTNLYKTFVDSKTKNAGMGAQSVSAYVDDKQLHPVFVFLDGIEAENLTAQKAAFSRQLITDELQKIADYPDHSPALLAFNKRFENSLTSIVRTMAKFENSPPKFGFRNTGDDWYVQLQELNEIQGFRKSVGFKPQVEEIRKSLVEGTNIWKSEIAKWKLVSPVPYVLVAKANPALSAKAEAEKKQRAEAEVNRLKALYHLTGDQETIAFYKSVYDSNTTILEKLEQAHRVNFIENPPLTLDDQLQYKQVLLMDKIPVTRSVFNNMTSATTGIALGLNTVPEDKLVYLALLPELLTQTGYIKNGKPVSYEEMIQQIQQQILSLTSYYSTGLSNDRAELVVKASGNNEAEAITSVKWINDVLKYPYWKTENLPRIRDLVEQSLSDIRKKMQSPEEYWVWDPNTAYERQNKPLVLATSSFLTRSHNIFRLKWMLKDAGSKSDSTAISHFLSSLANADTHRDQLKKLLDLMSSEKTLSTDSAQMNKSFAEEFYQLPPKVKALAKDAAFDLLQILNEIPDGSLPTDWKYLCFTIQHDLAQTPAITLKDLDEIRSSLLNENSARFFEIGSEETEKKMEPEISGLLSGFNKNKVEVKQYPNQRHIDQRVKERMNSNETIVFAGLINPDSHTGVIMNAAQSITYKDTSREKLLPYLAGQLYAGGGKQSVYTKTTGAGLSYSTGVWETPSTGKLHYYAERTPELPQTLSFVIDNVKNSPVDTSMLDYVVSLSVGAFRSADDYESRGEAMASDIADGRYPEIIRNFRESVLRLRKEPGLINVIYTYKDKAYETILPGYGKPSRDVAGGSYFVIGPEKQMTAYEAYLKSVNGDGTKLYRLYPRDYWMTR